MAIIRSFAQIPENVAEWERFLRDATVADGDIGTAKISDGSVTDAKLRDSAANSVIGRASATAGAATDIVAGTDNQFLVQRSSGLQFDGLLEADIPSTMATDVEVAASVAAEATARTAAIAAKFVSGSFTGTLSGCTTTPTGTLYYETANKLVTLHIPVISATSNTTAMTITGAPAAVQPGMTNRVPFVITDNGTTQMGLVQVETSGVLTFYADVTGGAFTNSGTKGSTLQTISYLLT